MTPAGHPRPDEALAIWLGALAAAGFAAPLDAEEVALDEALGRVLAENLIARDDVPNTRCAAMDGFAVRAAEVTGGAPLEAGAFVAIDTGEPVPAAFDAVVPVEVARVSGDALEVTGVVVAGDHVRPAAEDISAGSVVLRAGAVVDAYAVGVAAGAGHPRLAVRRRARVAVLATGDEIRPAGEPLSPGQTADANGPMLAALATGAGAAVTRHPPCVDHPELLTAALRTGAGDADLVLVIAGSSRGRRDLTPGIVAALGEVCVHGVQVRPAHPAGLGRIGAVPVVLVPGYPVSAAVAFALFAEPLLALLAGRPAVTALLPARLRGDILSRPGVETVVPVALSAAGGVLFATPLGRRASALSSLAAAHGFVRVSSPDGRVVAGTQVAVTPHRLAPDAPGG
ncbi:MAG: molybdopterin molybdotransferase [Gaiellaceae bacterium]|nr:molybdopterin molybdotransferase [Gaiellaceae bacterium]